MKLVAQREAMLDPLQAVAGVVERRQTMPILANILVKARGDRVSFTATDLEVELVASTHMSVEQEGEVTVPGRKLLDIVKALPEGVDITFVLAGDKVTVRAGRSRFTLSTLPATEFPVVEDVNAQQTVTLPQGALKRLLEKTHFAMAQQDVRYYLNGLLLEIAGPSVRAVATDGHRLALCEDAVDGADATPQQVILPRKGVLELQRLIADGGEVTLAIGTNHLRAELGDIRFTSKLIDGRFPDYERVIPAAADVPVVADREDLRRALYRTAILSNEKYRGIRLELKPGRLTMQAHNPEQEEAEEEIEVTYEGDDIEIGFNVNYLMDALSALESESIHLMVRDPNSSCLIEDPATEGCKYVVMPMRL
jgi:DNA polymerase-3 subunit beta